jgi:hypothetical protein
VARYSNTSTICANISAQFIMSWENGRGVYIRCYSGTGRCMSGPCHFTWLHSWISYGRIIAFGLYISIFKKQGLFYFFFVNKSIIVYGTFNKCASGYTGNFHSFSRNHLGTGTYFYSKTLLYNFCA